MKKVFLSVLSIVTILCIIYGTLHFIGGDHSKKDRFLIRSKGSSETVNDFSLPVFSEVYVDASVANVTIERAEKTGITVVYSHSDLRPEYSVKNGVLTVSQNGGRVINVGSGVKCDITIMLSSDVSSITVKTDVGNCTIDSVETNSLDVKSDVGNCTVKSGKAKSLTAGSDTGNIRIEKNLFETCHANSDVGNVRVELPQNADKNSYSVSMSSGVGDINAFGSSYKKSFKQDGLEGSMQIVIETGVGNARLE